MQIHKNICKNVEKYMKKCYKSWRPNKRQSSPYRGQHFWSKSAYFVYFAYFHIFLTCFSIYFDDFFDINLIVNKRGTPEAPPIHYPINFTSTKIQKNIKKHLKIYNNMWTYSKIYKNPSLGVTWSLSFYLRNFFRQQYRPRKHAPSTGAQNRLQSRLFDCQGWWPWLGWFT